MNCERAKIMVRGTVQGVGFRPFVYKLATELQLNGWVMNSSQGVHIEVEGGWPILEEFFVRLKTEKPSHAVIHNVDYSRLDAVGHNRFEIRHCDDSGTKTALILPDLATCPDCLREVFDPKDRRYLYPFTNCTSCGPRFTIIEDLPYDRPNTSMKHFKMCSECEAEYNNPLDRRFHAQPNSCPKCGPHLELWSPSGHKLACDHHALDEAANAVRHGKIMALKGLGGFHLIVDARDEIAVLRLRERKAREEKPFALMYPTLESIRMDCQLSKLEARLLMSPEAPIVLLGQLTPKAHFCVASSVAPGNSMLGVMLPYTPLHHLLLWQLGFPIVATSGNLTNEPICISEQEALERLHGVADLFLVHNRPITRHVDDSIVRVMLGREIVLRRSRGYAPLPMHLQKELPNVLAVGAHLKNTVAMSAGNNIFISQHIGDLETKEAYSAFGKVLADFQRLYEVTPDIIACDLHPDYLSTKFARQSGIPILPVQHHYAHVLGCMAENGINAPVLGVSWDGTGYGTDGTIWGGEFLVVNESSFERVAHLRPFKLPGGDLAIKQPRRCALGVLYEMFGDEAFGQHELALLQNFSLSELRLLRKAIGRGINVPLTSSIGRLFDAVASLVGLRHHASFEGQAAMEMEFAIKTGIRDAYPFEVQARGDMVVDWEPMILKIMEDIRVGQHTRVITTRFHNTLVEIITTIAHRINQRRIILSGGCFQNKYLTESTVLRLREEGFQPYWHRHIPTNDGGIALGQIMAAFRAGSVKREVQKAESAAKSVKEAS